MATMTTEKTNETKTIETMVTEHMQRLPLDEVAAAYFAAARVENASELELEFGGYKIGAIYAFVLGLLNQHINASLDARAMIYNALFAPKTCNCHKDNNDTIDDLLSKFKMEGK